MREIKFRFYCEDSDTLSKVFTIEELANGTYDWHGNIHKIVKNQYTGLKDKNGVEIYEGDIVRVNKLTYDKNNEFESFVSKIEFYMGSFHLDVKKMLLLAYGKDIEVIGNIYENKELLV